MLFSGWKSADIFNKVLPSKLFSVFNRQIFYQISERRSANQGRSTAISKELSCVYDFVFSFEKEKKSIAANRINRLGTGIGIGKLTNIMWIG